MVVKVHALISSVAVSGKEDMFGQFLVVVPLIFTPVRPGNQLYSNQNIAKLVLSSTVCSVNRGMLHHYSFKA